MPRLDRAATLSWPSPTANPLAQPRGLMLTDDRRVVLMTLLAQIGIGVGLAAVFALIGDSVVAVSVLLGGMTAVIPNAFLAARLLKPRADDSAGAVMRSAWLGLIGKLLLTALLFGVIFALVRPLSVPAVFGGFIAAQTAVYGALLLSGRTRGATAAVKS
jgi:ATP synthase protein I